MAREECDAMVGEESTVEAEEEAAQVQASVLCTAQALSESKAENRLRIPKGQRAVLSSSSSGRVSELRCSGEGLRGDSRDT